MADVSSSDAPVVDVDNSTEKAIPEGRKCSSCGVPLKGHPGPPGQSRCMVGRLITLRERLEQLEERNRLRVSEFAQHESLALERQEALLSTITALEERV